MIELGALTGWMDAQGLGSGPLEDISTLAGGTQNIMVLFTRANRKYVLRHPPEHPRPNSNETMRREARILGALAGTDVPHPRLIALCADETVLGAVFYLMEPIDGFNPVNGLPALHANSAAVRHRMGLALVEGIAALGAVDYKEVGLEGFGKPDGFLERQVPRWSGQLASYAQSANWPGPQGLPGVEMVGTWLEQNCPRKFTPGIMHGDYHLANVMYANGSGELAAIVDWELATIGDPLIDLGWLLVTWPEPGADAGTVSVTPWEGFPTAEELVEHYRQHTTRDLADIQWYAVLAGYKLGILLEGTYARACAGLAPTETGDRLHARAVNLLSRALARIERL